MSEPPRGLKHATGWLLLGLTVFLGVQAWQALQRQTRLSIEGQRVEIRRSADGHYRWMGRLAGRAVEFLVDTGATGTAIPSRLAEALGLPTVGTVQVATAGGVGRRNPASLAHNGPAAAAGRDCTRRRPVMSSAADFARHVPGFDFLQGLLKNAGAGLPNVGQWIAPTLDPAELDKRIQELKTVQFWLEQNARLLATTIQALEVQRMTLSTLQGMNLPMAELSESLKIKPSTKPAPEPKSPARPRRKATSRAQAAGPTAAAVDPMQWWGALTQQFTELAAQALRDTAQDGARSLAGAAVARSLDVAASALDSAASLPGKAAKAARAAARPAGRAVPKRR